MSQALRKAIIYTSPARSLYVGRVESIFRRTNVVSTLLVSLDDELQLVDGSSRQIHSGTSFLIPAGMDVTINTQGARVAMSFLDDMDADLGRLIPRMKSEVAFGSNRLFTGIEHEQSIIRDAEYLSRERPATEDAFDQFQEWIGQCGASTPCDERIVRTAELIRENYADNISVTELARQVNLSVPRLIQLFKSVTGTPIRRYRLWWRVLATAENLTAGHSLTDAAIAAGFCDYSQFSRVYRELTGGSPSAAKNNTEIRVLKRNGIQAAML
ncbi:helix-turn-helix domain-containing protein [Allohahella sp. A8]|uniref:helix-turn-helix domain-containing protein n=1 Tax=Allohahella sp. A8 TaxID=3141461 RepID=UPI003A7F642B